MTMERFDFNSFSNRIGYKTSPNLNFDWVFSSSSVSTLNFFSWLDSGINFEENVVSDLDLENNQEEPLLENVSKEFEAVEKDLGQLSTFLRQRERQYDLLGNLFDSLQNRNSKSLQSSNIYEQQLSLVISKLDSEDHEMEKLIQELVLSSNEIISTYEFETPSSTESVSKNQDSPIFLNRLSFETYYGSDDIFTRSLGSLIRKNFNGNGQKGSHPKERFIERGSLGSSSEREGGFSPRFPERNQQERQRTELDSLFETSRIGEMKYILSKVQRSKAETLYAEMFSSQKNSVDSSQDCLITQVLIEESKESLEQNSNRINKFLKDVLPQLLKDIEVLQSGLVSLGITRLL